VRLVVIESPFAGDHQRNARYLDACLADCLRRGEAPFASHGLYTRPGVLDDTKPEERRLGIAAGFAWRRHADATIAYLDLGVTAGMQAGVSHSEKIGIPVEHRWLWGEWSPQVGGAQ
jgi:hypothetical protein